MTSPLSHKTAIHISTLIASELNLSLRGYSIWVTGSQDVREAISDYCDTLDEISPDIQVVLSNEPYEDPAIGLLIHKNCYNKDVHGRPGWKLVGQPRAEGCSPGSDYFIYKKD